jgi:hypothetical protein
MSLSVLSKCAQKRCEEILRTFKNCEGTVVWKIKIV